MMPRLPSASFLLERQRGYTLVEVLVALLIALFLLVGLGSMVAGTRKTSTNQTSLAQLQDEERLAMSILNDVIQTAGYFDSNTYWAGAAVPANAAFPAAFTTTGTVVSNTTLAAGQIIGGKYTGIATPDTIAIRYSTSGSDDIINCNGVTGTAAATYVNYFFVNTATNELKCSVDGNQSDAITLVNNVVNLQVWYGVSTTAGTNNVDTYMTATQVATNSAWLNVTSVRVTLTFDNPLWGQAGQPHYAFFTRLIALKSRTGSSLVST